MFTRNTFIKKNRIGNFLKHCREHYIRDDISCGVPSCEKCQDVQSNLSRSHKNECELVSGDHYIILDTNVILNQMDVLDEAAFGNVIILHTVLNEVKHRSLPMFKRLFSIIENSSRSFYVFTNDHHKDTYLNQEDQELVNDYKDRCIRKACLWYRDHLPNEKFVFLTEDLANKRIAQSEGIQTFSIEEYVRNLQDRHLLEDKLAREFVNYSDSAKDIYPAHLSLVELLEGIKNGDLYQGTFRASRENYLEGFVDVETLMDSPVLVQGRESLNRAVDGDLVAVELLEKSEWTSPTELVLEDEQQVEENVIDDLIRREEGKLRATRKSEEAVTSLIKPTGKIVGIVRRKWRQYCGILDASGSNGLQQLFVPSNRSVPKIRIETRQSEFLKTQKLIVTIDSWPRNSRYPHGHFVRALGAIGQQDTENEVVLIEHDVPHSQFSNQVLECLPKLPWTVMEKDIRQRVDLRNLSICSVDPPGCTDIDDALHCRRIDQGTVEVGVHIADVSHFIRPGTALDLEASSRATTVYLVNKRIDMVPELLSSNLCSLRGGEERFAFSCIWQMDANANIINTKFHKSIIKSKRAMTYEEAQILIDDKSIDDDLSCGLRELNRLAKILKKRRIENGALVLASPEVKVHVDSETMEPLDVQVKTLFETNSMVEEFMLLANISVAHKILEDFPECAMLRRHPTPPQANFDPLVKAGRHLGFDIKTESGKDLARSLDEAVSETNVHLNTMLRIIATRCMLQAVYFPSGSLQSHEFFHYGLAVPLYTHFTSPIRRYADIVVHRLLAASCGADSTYPELLDMRKTAQLCQNLNYRNRMAQYAARASIAFNTHLFFKGKDHDAEGYVLYVKKNALQVLLPKYGLECTLYLSRRNDASSDDDILFEYDEEKQTQRAGDVVFHCFDPITVRVSLDSTNVQHEKFALQLVEPYVKGFSVERGRQGMVSNVSSELNKRKAKNEVENTKKTRGPSEKLV